MAHVLPAGLDPLSGVATAVVHLAVALARRHHDVELWPLHRLTQLDRHVYEPLLQGSGVSWVPVSGPLVARGRRLRGRRVDIVHLHSVFSPPNAVLAAQLRVPYLLSPHGGYAPAALQRGRRRKRVYGAVVERRLVMRAAAGVALTAAEAQDLASFARPGVVQVIPNGVSPPPSVPPPRTLREQLGLGEHVRLALFVGRMDVHHKGLDRLVRALADAPDWHAVLAGGDARGGVDAVKRLADQVGVAGRLHLVGPRTGTSLEEAFAAADLFVLASRWEGLPLALLEAVARGLPALVTPEVEAVAGVARAGAGWAASPDDLAAELRRLAQLEVGSWRAAGAAARALASGFSWDRTARAHEELYASLLGTGTGLVASRASAAQPVGDEDAHASRGSR